MAASAPFMSTVPRPNMRPFPTVAEKKSAGDPAFGATVSSVTAEKEMRAGPSPFERRR